MVCRKTGFDMKRVFGVAMRAAAVMQGIAATIAR